MAYVFRTKRPDGTLHPRWRFQYTDFLGRRRTGSGTTNRAETEKLATSVQAEQDAIRKGWRPAPKVSDTPRPFAEVVAEYLAWGAAQGGRGGRPWGATHDRMRKTHLAWWTEHLDVEFLSDLVGSLGKVERALRDLEAEGRSGKTVQNYAEAIGALCDWAVERQYLDSDPLGRLKSFDCTPQDRRRAMTPEEIQKLLAACAPQRRLCYEVAFTTGLRARELASLRVRHLDVERRGLVLDAAWTKARRGGFQPVPSWLVDRLAAASTDKAPDDALLYVPTHPARDLADDLAAAGIAKRTADGKLDFHACRVAYVTFVIEAGATASEAQTLARHATPALTMNVYARTRDERLAQVAEAVGEALRAPAKRARAHQEHNKKKSTTQRRALPRDRWWRRRESNPRPRMVYDRLLHA